MSEPIITKVVERSEPVITEERIVDKALKELEDKISVLKERGNTQFKKQAYKEAIK